MNKRFAQNLVNKTRDDYNKIADHFSSTRQFIWPDIAVISDKIELKAKSKVLDLGCGNGRFCDSFIKKGVEYYGFDISENLIKIAKTKNPKGHFLVGDLLKTPYKDNEFDFIMSIATLHHVPSKEMRDEAIQEINRVLKTNGKIVISVWYFWDKSKYLKLITKETLKKMVRKSNLDFGDFEKPWQDEKKEKVTNRYFHAWRKKELINMLKKNGFIVESVELSKSNKKKLSRNLIIIAKKN